MLIRRYIISTFNIYIVNVVFYSIWTIYRTFFLEYFENFGLQYYLVNEEACFFNTNDFLENKFIRRVLYVLCLGANNYWLSFLLTNNIINFKL